MEQPTFEERWPELEVQLRAALTRRRIPVDAREDVLQETALRLLRSWDRVRPESLWAFALTVALNIVRDEARKKERHERSCFASPILERDPEHEAIVRIELDRVRVALTTMTERQRTVLLGEIGEAAHQVSTPAQKMARMRARRRLRSLIEDVSGVIALPAMKLRRWVHDADTALANTAATWAMRLASVGTVAVVAVPAAIGSPSGSSSDPTTSGTRSLSGRGSTAVDGSTLAHGSNRLELPILSGPTGRAPAGRAKSDEMNQHFGVLHKEGDSFVLGGDEQVGPYGIHQKVAQSVGGSKVGAELKARYDAARCLNKFLQRPHSPCPRGGRLRGRVSAVVDNEKKDVIIESVEPTN